MRRGVRWSWMLLPLRCDVTGNDDNNENNENNEKNNKASRWDTTGKADHDDATPPSPS